MSEWFYTANKQQLGPVSFEELQQLASRGTLRPSDLVWRDGMRDWMKASTQGLFDDRPGMAAAGAAAEARPSRWDTEDDRPRRPSRREEPDEDEERPRRRFRDEGMSVGVKVGLILGGVVLLLTIVGVIIFVAADSGGNAGPAGGPVGIGTYNGFLNWNDPRDTRMRNPCKIYTVSLQANKTYHIELRAKGFDAYLRLEDSNFLELAANDDGAGGRPFCGPLDSLIVYTPAKTDNFRIIATSLNGQTGNFILNIQEGPAVAFPWKK